MCQLILHFRSPTRGWREGQITCLFGLIQLTGIDIREGVAEVQSMNRMHIHTCLKTQQSGITLCVFVGLVPLLHHHIITFREDIVADSVGKKCHLRLHALRCEIHTEVCLPTVFCFQIRTAYLIAHRTLVHTVSTQFTHVRCPETTSHIHPHVPMLISIPHSTHTACHPIEIFCVVIFQMTMIITHTTIQCPTLPLLAYRGITAKIK